MCFGNKWKNRVNQEFRCLKRSDLVKVMADNLPKGTIRTNCQVLSIDLDPVTNFPHLMLSNGTVIHAKVYLCLFLFKTFRINN